jgi:hypothetical protein
MLKTRAFVLCHPQSKDIVKKSAFNSSKVEITRIACGTTKPKNVDLYESGDFSPTYASLNSSLFESSVILTIWEHADSLIGQDNVAILHTDIYPHFKPSFTWNKISETLAADPNGSVGVAVSNAFEYTYNDWLIPESVATQAMTPKRDPMMLHDFDANINIWSIIRKYDEDIYEYAMDVNPSLIYSHQFACTRATFDYLGQRLLNIVRALRLSDIGFWTPHVLERMIALYLSQRGKPYLTTAFWHYYSSGSKGPGDLSLYGPRPFKYYNVGSRIMHS